MNSKPLTQRAWFAPAFGAVITALCGLALWSFSPGWALASYDYLFRFATKANTNQVVFILMDNASYMEYGQTRGQWDRGLHAQLLNKLADDHCRMVVFDIFFGSARNPDTDAALAEAMRRVQTNAGQVVLMAKAVGMEHPDLEIAEIKLPYPLFLDASTGWGIPKLNELEGQTVRQHWPFPAPPQGESRSLAWSAAQLAGGRLNRQPQEQWLRYYGENGPGPAMSYRFALSNAPGFFRNKIVFIGNKPSNDDPTLIEEDKFRTPYTRWTGHAVGGVEIVATMFLNLMNGDWLLRPAKWSELLLMVATGILLGGGLCRIRPLAATGIALGAGLAMILGGVWLYHAGGVWFPWLVIVAGQVPCAIALAWLPTWKKLLLRPRESAFPDYELFDPPFGEGAFGKVWVARNAIGQWQALKKVDRNEFLKKYNNDRAYQIEFEGITKYKPVSELHPGLLRVELVSKQKPEGYFYYVMELADAQREGWQDNPAHYKPWTLETLRSHAAKSRLPVCDCIAIGTALCETLDFLHTRSLTHRDIKPSNVIFIKGLAKLADVGLVTDARDPGQEATQAGTPGYMPPSEPNGTIQADIYALGMTLYVVSTGQPPAFFPELSTTLMEPIEDVDFMRLNLIILKACHPDRGQRYRTAAEMLASLRMAGEGLRLSSITQLASHPGA